jgi:hypothetical protein
LGDAIVHAVVDYSHGSDKRIGAMPDGNAVPAVLQRADGVWEGRGKGVQLCLRQCGTRGHR